MSRVHQKPIHGLILKKIPGLPKHTYLNSSIFIILKLTTHIKQGVLAYAAFRSDIELNFMIKEKPIFRFDNSTYTSQKILNRIKLQNLKMNPI